MKKIMSLSVITILFCCVGIFAEDTSKNNEEISKEDMKKAEQYVEQMTSFAATFMNSFKNFFDQDEKQEIVNKDEKKLGGITLFPKKKEGDVLAKEDVRIFQVLKPNIALVKSGTFPNEMLMLLIGDDDDLYYDNQKINVPKEKSVKQVGIYQYNTKSGELKTIPAVKIK